MNKLAIISSISLAVFTAPAYAAAQSAPVFIDTVSKDLIQRIKKDRAAAAKDPSVYKTIVKEEIVPHVDFDGFAKGVMGRYYRGASPEQVKRFESKFQSMLIDTYAKYLGEYDNESYTLRPFTPLSDPKKAVVTMDFKTDKGQIVPVSYQLVDNGSWKIRNVKIEGIDIGLTFRKQFGSTVEANRGSLDAAIKNFVPKQPAN